MRSNNGTHSVYGLCHYPYENQNTYTDQFYIKHNMMQPHLPFNPNTDNYHHRYTSYTPDSFMDYSSSSSSNPGSNAFYQDQDVFNSFDNEDRMKEALKNNGRTEVSSRMRQPKAEFQEVVELNRTPPKSDSGKPTRQYRKKSEQEKKIPGYLEGRKKNNDAVRKTRMKRKLEEEKRMREYEEMKKLYEDLKTKNEDLIKEAANGRLAINLIKSFQHEVNTNPHRFNLNFSPAVNHILHFQC